jgi:hypothetical protein
LAYGNPSVLVIDRRHVLNHQYLIRGVTPDSAGSPSTITLADSTDGRILLFQHELPDSLGQNMSMTDGFKLLRGNIEGEVGRMRDYQIPSGTRRWTFSETSSLDLEGFGRTIGNAFEHWPSGGVPFSRQRNVLIKFAATDTAGMILDPSSPNVSWAYRYLQNADKPAAQASFSGFIVRPGIGDAYQDFTTLLPFAAFDQDTTPPRRLAVGYLENNVPGGSVDGHYWPPLFRTDNTSPDSPREWFFIFDLPYGTTADAELEVDIGSVLTPLMWFGTPTRGTLGPPTNTDQFLIVTWHGPVTGDVWSFNPVTMLGGVDKTIPTVFDVFPNYPNPFNGGTTIKYALPFDARVVLRIYNILGQEVRLLADGQELEGYRTLQWDGRSDQGMMVGSGVYFYRLEATSASSVPEALTHIGKMVVIR